MYNERAVYIVLKNSAHRYAIKLQSDPRRWLPNGVITDINEQITLPSYVAEGTYSMYLHMPDAYESLANDPRYAVRFANENIWDATTGMNKLNANIQVSNADPGSIDPIEPIVLPATLDVSNVSNISEDMSWYSNDYFDFGSEDAPNTERWVVWDVELRQAIMYYISETMASNEGRGHSWLLELIKDEQVVSSYKTEDTWVEGEINYENPWDLTNVPTGAYRLRVHNVMEWGQPKLKSLTIADSPLPVENVTNDQTDEVRYDVLGRQVDKNYRGIVISKGKKWLQQ